MASATDLPRNSADDLTLRWSGRWSLTARILAINVFALVMLVGSVLYLDSYRSRLFEERSAQFKTIAEVMADALAAADPGQRQSLAGMMGRSSESRLRIYAHDGALRFDSWTISGATYELRDPEEEPWRKDAARWLDRTMEVVAAATIPAAYKEPAIDRRQSWPEAELALRSGTTQGEIRFAPDRTPMFSAAAALHDPAGGMLLVTTNARDVTRDVRAERFWSAVILSGVVALSVLLSLFLARTIVRPLRRLALAAHRVKQGRAREVMVPRLPSRRDEIGLLARALSDMSQALRKRIDATEAFAADVAHELKNPLASLRSAVEALDHVADPALQKQLLGLVRDDVLRIDRLITDIAEASRLDAELSRARFERIDLGLMLDALVSAREARSIERHVRLAFARPEPGTAVVMGEDGRLVRVFENLIDNATSFSPVGGLVQISATRDGERVQIRVDDEGPGVPAEAREAIFRRFHSERPEGEAFGQHSGLGLAIAKAIVEAHGGTIIAEDRADAHSGARFTVALPAATGDEL